MKTRKLTTACALLLFAVVCGGRLAAAQLDAYAAIRSYDFGDDRSPLVAIESAARGASPAALKRIEAQLLVALQAPETRYAGKQFIVRMLRRIGSDACVAPLAALLTDPKLSHNARFALQNLPSKAATAALRKALAETKGKLRIGIVSSLAERGDPDIADDLRRLLSSPDRDLVVAAVRGLGRLGGEKAVASLFMAELPSEVTQLRFNALLACAEKRLAKGKTEAAARIYNELAVHAQASAHVRLAAIRGVLLTQRGKAVPRVIELLGSSESALRDGALRLLSSTPGADVTRAIAAQLAAQSPEREVALINTLVERRDKAAYEAVAHRVSSSSSEVRVAALRALGTLGNAQSVPSLVANLTADGEEGKAAFESLTTVDGFGVVPAILKGMQESDDTAVKVIECLVARREKLGLPAIFRAAADKNDTVRAAAQTALGALAEVKDLEMLAEMMLAAERPADRDGLAKAVRDVAARAGDKNAGETAAATKTLVGLLAKAETNGRIILMSVLPVLSTAEGLAAARQWSRDSNALVARAAVSAMADWETPEPLRDLLAIAKGEPSELQGIAVRGYTRLLALPSDRTALETVELLDESLALTDDVDARRRVIQQLANFPCKEALALAERFASDPKLGNTAKHSAQKIRGVLIANNLVATASHNSRETKRAFDKDPRSRWSTNTPMKPGMWFMVDLGSEQTVTRIILDTRGSPGDYPRGCEVYVSSNGKTWGKPVVTSPPQRPVTRLILPQPARGRFVKIVQTGETQGLFWSIHNMRVDFE